MKTATIVTAFACGLFWAAGTTPMPAQGLPSVLSGKKAPTPPAATPATDPLGRETPRNSMYEFLEACHKGDYSLAAQYLNLTKIPAASQGRLGPERARQLSTILDRDAQFELEQLDNTPAGSNGDALASDVDRLVTLTVNGRPTPLYLERVTRADVPIWLVSAESVVRLPELQSFGQG